MLIGLHIFYYNHHLHIFDILLYKRNFFCSAYFKLLINFNFFRWILESSCLRFSKLYPQAIQIKSYSYGKRVFCEHWRHCFAYFCIISSSDKFIYHLLYYWVKLGSFITSIFSSGDSFVGCKMFSFHLPVKQLIRYEGMVSCIIWVMVYIFYLQFVESPFWKILSVSAVLTNRPSSKFAFQTSLLSLRLLYTNFSIMFLLAWMESFLSKWIVLLNFLTTDGNSLNQSAIPFKKNWFLQ